MVALAFEPHFSSAYRLDFGMLVANLSPYLVFAPLAWAERATWVGLLGLGLLALHGILLTWPTIMLSIWPDTAAVYSAPLLLALLLAPLVALKVKPGWEKA